MLIEANYGLGHEASLYSVTVMGGRTSLPGINVRYFCDIASVSLRCSGSPKGVVIDFAHVSDIDTTTVQVQ